MKVIFTCGGTAGHINPAISVARLLQARKAETEILFVGAEGGMEEKLVPRAGFRLKTLKISNYQRNLTPKGVWHNCGTAEKPAQLPAQGGSDHPRISAGRHRRDRRIRLLPDAQARRKARRSDRRP